MTRLRPQAGASGMSIVQQNARKELAQLEADRDTIRQRMLDRDLQAAADGVRAQTKAEETKVANAQRTAEKLLADNDRVYKAQQQRDNDLKELDAQRGKISADMYARTKKAIEDTYDTAVERADKAANQLSIEEKALSHVAESYSLMATEIQNARIANKALSESSDFTAIDIRANERVIDFLIDFAKRANITAKSLEDLADAAGISLTALRNDFRALEVEATKRKALERGRELTFEAAETDALAIATLKGADAYAEAARQIEVEREIRKLGLDAKDADITKTRDEIRAKLDAVEASKAYARAAQEGNRVLEEYGNGSTQIRLKLEKLAQTQRALAEKGALTDEMRDAFARAELDAIRSTDSIEGTFLRAFDDIGDALGDTLKDAFKTGELNFKYFAHSLTDIFVDALA